MSANGRLRDDEVTDVQNGIRLGLRCAAAFRALQKAARDEEGHEFSIAKPGGGYRDFDMQDAMKRGIPTFAFWNLNEQSAVDLAPAGSSSHGTGDRVDIVPFGGRAGRWLLRRASDFGFTREFGASDPNHYQHDGVTAARFFFLEVPMAGAIKAMQIRDAITGGISAVIPGALWQDLDADYYTLWLARGWFEENDFTKSPNVNVATNEVAYLRSIYAPPGPPRVVLEDPETIRLLKEAIAAGDEALKKAILEGFKTISIPPGSSGAEVADLIMENLPTPLANDTSIELGNRTNR